MGLVLAELEATTESPSLQEIVNSQGSLFAPPPQGSLTPPYAFRRPDHGWEGIVAGKLPFQVATVVSSHYICFYI